MLYLLLLSLVIHTVMFTLTRSLFISPSRLLFKSFGSRKKGQYSGPLHYSRDGQQQQKQQQQIPTSSPSEPKLAKRKVALVFSYVGTMYNGLQMDSQQLSMGFVAVEAVIERELHNLKYIKDSNHLDLAKIGWSRSSRTDKGVHCTRIVLSAKLEFNPSDLPNDNDPPFIHSIVEQMNERLPSDIRMVSCFRVTGSFRARHNCVWREYEYLLPINGILTNLNAISTGVDMEKSAVTKEQLIARLNKYLRRFEGENSLHNFHRTARRDLRTRRPSFASNLFSDTDIDIDTSSTSKQYKSESDQSVSDPIDSSAEDADADDGMLESLDSTLGSGEESSLNTDSIPGDSQKESGSENILITNQYERWYPIPRDMIPKTQGTIYVCEVRDVVVVDGVELVRICVRGQSFLLHQIRMIIGTAIHCSLGLIPEEVFEAAFVLPYHVPLPMAPAEGLMLVNSGYILNSKTQGTSSNSAYNSLSPYERPRGVTAMGDSLLTESQFEASEAFKAEHIYPQIVRDWRGDDLAHEWLAENAPRYTFPATSTPYCNPITNSVNKGPLGIGIDALELWRSGRQEALIKIYEELPTTSVEFWNALVAADPTVITNHETDILRVEKDLFRRQRFLGILNNRTSEEDSVPQTKSSMKPKFKYTDREDAPMMYQELLPTGMYTALTVYARIPPGPEISAGCLGIASLVARGDIRIEWTPDEIIRHIEPLGGLAYLINQPIDPRLH